jgi:GNAT superfamily N-acetyltransferase
MSTMGSPEIEIRTAVLPADAEGLADVYLSSARHHAALDPVHYRVPERDAVVSHYRHPPPGEPTSTILVADTAGRIVAAAEVRMLPPPLPARMLQPVPTADIELAVVEEARSRGVGEALMRVAEDWAIPQGARTIHLDALAANHRALEFYSNRLGYKPFGVILSKTRTPDQRAQS